MEVYGEGGVLVSLLGRMGWVYRRILGGVGGSFQVISDLRWERASMLDFGMICGVEIGRSSSVIQFCSALLVFKTLGWLIICLW